MRSARTIDQEAIGRVLETLPLPDGVHFMGALLYGSYAADAALPTSDVDIIAIVREPVIWRKFYRAEDADVDLFVYGKQLLMRRIRNRAQPWVQMVASSVALSDPAGIVAKAQGLARAHVSGPAPPCDPRALRRYRHRVVTARDDCFAEAQRDPDVALTRMAAELPPLVEKYLEVRRIWQADFRTALDRIRATDRTMFDFLVTAMTREESCARRLDAFDRAVAHALEPCGGEVRYFEIFLADNRGEPGSL